MFNYSYNKQVIPSDLYNDILFGLPGYLAPSVPLVFLEYNVETLDIIVYYETSLNPTDEGRLDAIISAYTFSDTTANATFNDITSNFIIATSGGTFGGITDFNVLSAITYQNLPLDIRVTGGTYDSNNGIATFINNTGGTFNVTGFLSPSGATDYYVTGGTYNQNNGVLTLVRGNGDVIISGFTDIRVTGGTYSSGTAIFTNNTGGTFNISGFISGDTYVTGGTYSNGTTTFTNNTGGIFNITGFFTGSTDVFVTGGTANNSTLTYNFINNTGGTFNVNALTDVRVTGGTYSNSTGIVTLTNNTGGTFNINGFFKPSDDIYTTGLTINNENYDLTLSRNDGVSFIANLGSIASDVTITGGTYNSETGVVTFTNGSGGTFNVSGFTSGITDTIITNFNYNNNTFTINDSSGNTFNASINSVTGLTVSGNLISDTISATTYQNLPLDIRVTGGTYSLGTTTFTNNTGGTFTITGFTTPFTGGSISGGITATTFSGTNIYSQNVFSDTISATTYQNLPLDIRVTGGTYSLGTTTFTNNTGGTFNVSGFTILDVKSATGTTTVTSTANSSTWIDIGSMTIAANDLGSIDTRYLINFTCTAALTANNGQGNFRVVLNNNLLLGSEVRITNGGNQFANNVRSVATNAHALNVINGDIIKVQFNSPTGQLSVTDRALNIMGFLTSNLV